MLSSSSYRLVVLRGSANEDALARAPRGSPLRHVYEEKVATDEGRALARSKQEARESMLRQGKEGETVFYFGSKFTFAGDNEIVRLL